jgi:hypothetical protein
MRIWFRSDGGFAAIPALQAERLVDTHALDDDQADRIVRIVHDADFFARPPRVTTLPAGAADYRFFTITVDDGERRHTVQVDEPIADLRLRRLVEGLETL